MREDECTRHDGWVLLEGAVGREVRHAHSFVVLSVRPPGDYGCILVVYVLLHLTVWVCLWCCGRRHKQERRIIVGSVASLEALLF